MYKEVKDRKGQDERNVGRERKEKLKKTGKKTKGRITRERENGRGRPLQCSLVVLVAVSRFVEYYCSHAQTHSQKKKKKKSTDIQCTHAYRNKHLPLSCTYEFSTNLLSDIPS